MFFTVPKLCETVPQRMVDDISSSNNNNRERLRTYSNAFLSRYSASTPCFCMHDTLPVDLPDLYPSDTLILGLSILTLGIFTTHTHTHTFDGSFSGTTQLCRYQKGKTDLDFTEARDSEWQWHQLDHMQWLK